MAIEITVPRLGWSMDEGIFGEWLKRDGDRIEPGDPLFVLEVEKAAQEIPSMDGGILRIVPEAPQPGETVRVGQLLAYLVAPGESAPVTSSEPMAKRKAHVAESQSTTQSTRASSPGQSNQSLANKRSRPAITPRARFKAAALGVDLTRVAGTGRAGRIRERDVAAAAEASREPIRPQRTLPITAVRRQIAKHMCDAFEAAAPVTLTTSADADNLASLRQQFKRQALRSAAAPGYTEILIKLAATALCEHPMMSAQWHNDVIVMPDSIDICVAVDTDYGLVAPVIGDVPSLTLRQVTDRVHDLATKARSRSLSPKEMQGGTFTVTNLGAFGVDAFTPLLHLPQCAILGIGRVRKVPVVRDESIVVGKLVTLSLTFDHRIVDGAPAARFLDLIRRLVENPGPALIA